MPTVTNPQTEIHRAAAEPTGGNVQEGHLWYNTSTQILSVKRGSTWHEITLSDFLDGDITHTVTINGGTF